MYPNLLQGLSPEQKAALREHGISDQLRSDWRNGRRLPTELQVIALAEVTGQHWADIQADITELRAPETERDRVRRIMGKPMHGAAAISAICTAAGGAALVAASRLLATMYIM